MNKQKFNKSTLAAMTAPKGVQRIVWDADQQSFGVLISGTTGCRTFIVQKNAGGRNRRVSIGRIEEFEAKSKQAALDLSAAELALAEAQVKKDPVAEARARVEWTRAEAWTDPIKAARGEAIRVMTALRDGQDPEAARGCPTLQLALESFLKQNVKLKPRTQVHYRSVITRYFEKWLDVKLSGISSKDILSRLSEIQQIVAEGQEERVSRLGDKRTTIFTNPSGAPTADIAFRCLRAVWKMAHENDRSSVPPWETGYFRGKRNPVYAREAYLPGEKIKPFVEAVNSLNERGEYRIGRQNRDMILLILFTGLRSMNVFGLKWDQVDFGRRVLAIPRTSMKGSRAPLTLPLADFTFNLLYERHALGTEGPWVFPSVLAKSGHVENLKRPFDIIEKFSGVRVDGGHLLRHTAITLSDDCPISNDRRMMMFGHSGGVGATTKRYTHISTDALREPVQLLADKIMDLAGIPKQRIAFLTRVG